MPAQLKIAIDNFRAIQKAEIVLDGITVVSGENGCGKSTISQLLYLTFWTQRHLENLAAKELYDSLRSAIRIFSRINDDGEWSDTRTVFHQGFEKLADDILFWLETVKNSGINLSIHKHFFQDTLQELYKNSKSEPKIPRTSKEIFEKIIQRTKEIIVEKRAKFLNRDAFYLYQELRSHFRTEVEGHFEIFENAKTRLIGNREHRLVKTWIEDAIYIDTPVFIDIMSSVPHWNRLSDIIRRGEKFEASADLLERMQGENVLGGKILNYQLGGLRYQPTGSSAEYSLAQCATGVKSMAILYQLLATGFLDETKLVVIDEPEVHLHPQWIVEYAKMIVLIHKQCGTRFFLASHSPDMINALKHIALREKVEVNFYLAEKQSPGKFNYRALGNTIEDIFESFNIALDRIDEYGAFEDD